MAGEIERPEAGSATAAGGAWPWLVLVLVAAAVLRLWGTFDSQVKYIDEWIHVPSAVNLLAHGSTRATDWAHPPLHGLLLQGSIALLGDRPLGWRLVGALLGVASVLLLWLVAARRYPGTRVPLVAAALLAFDPFHAHFARTAYMEVPLAFFFLLFLWLLQEHVERQRPALALAGLAMGLTIATKTNYDLCIALLLGWAAWRTGAWRGRGRATDLLLALLVLPASVHLLTYLQWFGRGHTLAEWVQHRLDALSFLASLTPDAFMFPGLIELGGRPAAWFLAPAAVGFELGGDGQAGRFLLEVNNPPFRVLVLPALALVAARAWRHRDAGEALVPALFAGAYAVPLLLDRPVFSHSALPVLPFAYLLVGRALDLISAREQWRPWSGRLHAAFLVGVAAWGCYVFPLYAGLSVPRALYAPILSFTGLLGTPP